MATIEVLDTDITKLELDAIANAANTDLMHGGGVAGAISRAGGPTIQDESEALAPIGLGEAVATGAGELPVAGSCTPRPCASAARPPRRSFAKRPRARCVSPTSSAPRSFALVAFGTGVGGFPLAEAARIETEEVRRHLAAGSELERIVFCVHGEEAREAFESALSS